MNGGEAGCSASVSSATESATGIAKLGVGSEHPRPNRPSAGALLHATLLGDAARVASLLAAGADPNASVGGSTALNAAAGGASAALVDLLLRASASMAHAEEEDGATALHIAAQEGRDATVALLLAAHANLDRGRHDGETALALAMRRAGGSGKHRAVATRLLAARADATHAASSRPPLLIVACSLPADVRPSFVSSLLACAATPDCVSGKAQRTPLCLAAAANDVPTVQHLCAAKATVDLPMSNGATPLACACSHAAEGCVAVLLEQRADPALRKSNGASPL
jgi:ankyrin repeat protein